ncbi:conserved hypothetical protein [Leishmania major strain Friedlin]|uniref:Uncharacterized protein n=1 Tax=Leishmania major TaxID=5664 RepID=Q4QG25_LEIMA|nr:conserved hypothetical protein [Leishmania major strain Friedlin]CAG9571115.1 hypothetical_protein_-_conserved [Leishmania major strain Friedlin]CAJ03085.1 conserved hypothetical protein [Leishmania major strain Friedlin]|eukprot:XP_001681873.1 conserved hypothetical protein [Leishmania major strain Friedlin]
MAEAVDRCLTAAQNSERDEEGCRNSGSPYRECLVTPTRTAAAKARQHPVTVAAPQARPTFTTSLASSPRSAKMESSSRGIDKLPQQRQQPVSPGSPSSHALSSTAVPVQHLYRVPSAFYAHNSVTSSAVLSAARSHRGRGDTFTGLASPRIFAEDSTHKQVRLPPEVSCSPSGMDTLEERARRAAELHASCGIREEAETVLPWSTGNRSGKAGWSLVPVSSSLLTVQVARGHRISRHPSGLGAEERSPLDVASVRLVPGSKRWRRPERMGSSADVRLDQRLSCTSSHDGGGGAAVPMRCLTSPSASSSSSVALASPQSPATALVSATAPARGISATRLPAPSPPFNALLAAFGPAQSGIAALTAGVIDPPLTTPTVPPTRPPAWLRPWLSHALSRTMAAHLERDADTVTAAASSAATSTQGLDSFPPVAQATTATASAASGSAQPRTLRSALLLIFDGLERFEADLAEVLLGGPKTHGSSNFFQGVDVRDCRASFAFSPSPPAGAAASGVFDGLVEQLRRLTRQWCEVLSQWPCEAATLGYVEWWMVHPAWTDLVTCDAAIPATLSASSATPATTDRKTTAGRRTETSHDGERQPPQPQPQESAVVLQGILAAAVTEGMRTLLDALVDAFVRAVSELLHSTAVLGPPRSASQTTSCPDLQAEVAAAGFAKAQHTCLALLHLLTSLYVSPPRVLQQLRTLVQADVCCGTAVTGAAANSDGKTTTRHEDEGSPASPSSLSTATAAVVAGEDRQHQPHPHPHPSPSSLSTPRGGPPGSPSVSRVGVSALDTSQLRSRACQLHYQLLYAVCRLCNELPMLWQPQDDTRDAEGDEESNGVRASSAAYMHLSPRRRHHGECERVKLTLFSTAARLAATVSALLLHVQLPMKGDLLCVASRLAQWRATLLRSSCMSEREYAAAMGHLCALMAQAT